MQNCKITKVTNTLYISGQCERHRNNKTSSGSTAGFLSKFNLTKT